MAIMSDGASSSDHKTFTNLETRNPLNSHFCSCSCSYARANSASSNQTISSRKHSARTKLVQQRNEIFLTNCDNNSSAFSKKLPLHLDV